jgi:preprotein translocase subunit YajC
MLFTETIALSGTYTTGGITAKVTKAREISGAVTITTTSGYVAEVVSTSGQSITFKVYVMPSTAAAGPLVEQASAGSIPASITVVYDGY